MFMTRTDTSLALRSRNSIHVLPGGCIHRGQRLLNPPFRLICSTKLKVQEISKADGKQKIIRPWLQILSALKFCISHGPRVLRIYASCSVSLLNRIPSTIEKNKTTMRTAICWRSPLSRYLSRLLRNSP